MKWYVDNLLIGTLDAGANGSFSANGKPAFSYSDPTSNASDNPPLSFVLIDNLQVVPEPSTAALCVIGVAALMVRRRQTAG